MRHFDEDLGRFSQVADPAVARTILEDAQSAIESVPRAAAEAFLVESSRPTFLGALTTEERKAWFDVCLRAIRAHGHGIGDLMRLRAEEIGEQPLFEELDSVMGRAWTYRAARRRTREFAAALWQTAADRPRIAIWSANSVESACADLACLSHDLLVVPLSVHLSNDEVAWILDRLDLRVVLADTEERVRRALLLKERGFGDLEVFSLAPTRAAADGRAPLMAEAAAALDNERVEEILASRSRRRLDDAATVMFTSGSTGRPKGVVFTEENLIAKRYARAAALPDVGHDERMVCYLPLFHTFGRFLEMLGSIYWRGTYVFAGNPSFETLMQGFARVRPTGLISIPLRWQQIRDHVLARSDAGENEDAVFDKTTGGALRWGLSAAGYLDPRVFRFFHRHGVALGSGFGMTEATGGITMSPPDDYVEETVGVPLPGIEIHLDDPGEMLIRGPYVARYLDDEGQDLQTVPPEQLEGKDWLRTGDVFQRLERGHVRIVDRVKDIYKNSRGQTVAPRRVEDHFQDVPGIHRVFLVGDHRPYNTLLVVPDLYDPVLRDAPDEHSRHEYLGHVINAANYHLAPYERVVNFALIDRDFEAERDELTPKGSLRRKQIETNFAVQIERLYSSPYLKLRVGELEVRIPQWLVRDMNALEDDLIVRDDTLVNRRQKRRLHVARDGGGIRIGDLVYDVRGEVVDLGRLTRQPGLWMGNAALEAFCPCKDGWDVDFGTFGHRVRLPRRRDEGESFAPFQEHVDLEPLLMKSDRLVQIVLHAERNEALAALDKLSALFGQIDEQLDLAVRERLTALAEHPDETLRCEAYRVLLLDEPSSRYNEAFGAFVESGLPFLSRSSIRRIATQRFGRRRLEALRQRLAYYRAERRWPASPVARRQFLDVLRLLVDFAREQSDYYHPIRCELASWVLLGSDPELATRANRLLNELIAEHENALEERARERPPLTREQVVFDDDVDQASQDQQWRLLESTAFIDQSIQLAFNETDFDPHEICPGGLWISPAFSSGGAGYFRWSVKTKDGRHYQLLVIVRPDLSAAQVMETNYWMLAIGGHPFGERVLPRFGCARPSLGAMSLAYVQDLSVDERIRRAVGAVRSGGESSEGLDWRDLYLRGMGAVFRAWENSGRRLAPFVVRTDNVVVPVIDIREGARVLSLAGWRRYDNPTDLLRPIWRGFYARVRAHHPESDAWIDEGWIVEALVEALGATEAKAFLVDALEDESMPEDLRSVLRDADHDGRIQGHVPQAVRNAQSRYERWRKVNSSATLDARVNEVESLLRLYRLERYGEPVRYQLYRDTVFSDAPPDACEAFDRLLAAMRERPDLSATRCVELSELQSRLDPSLRSCLAHVVFPHVRRTVDLEVMTFGEPGHERVTVRTQIVDRGGAHYDVREPIGADEVGQVYRLFYREHFARAASESDRFLVVLDPDGRVIAGLIQRREGNDVLHLEGMVVRASLWGRGIASALLEDLCARAAGRGLAVVRTNFVMRRFCERRGFRVDRRWGGLVRFLSPEAENREKAPSADV